MTNTSNEYTEEKNIELLIETLHKDHNLWSLILSKLWKSDHRLSASRLAQLLTLKNKDLSILVTELETLFLIAMESKISQHTRSKMENSMITDADNHSGLIERVLPHYLPILEQKGKNNIIKGVDIVLKEFEDSLVSKIDFLTKTPGMGENARQNFLNRREIKDQIGKYHTLLRLLLDKTNVARYESLFYAGSTAEFTIKSKSYSFRLLLAIYYLAATDPHMQFSLKWIEINIQQLTGSTLYSDFEKIRSDEEKVLKYCEKVRTELTTEHKQLLLQKSQEHFINVLSEDVRRAHNGDPGFPAQDDKLDAPSCVPGTINKLLGSCISNELTYVPVPNARGMIELIDAYITNTIEAVDNTSLRKALYEWLDTILMSTDFSLDATILYSEYILSLNEEQHRNNIYQHLKNSQFKFDIKNLSADLQKEVDSCIFKIIQIKQGEFLFLPQFGREGFFAAKLFNIGAKTKAKQDLYAQLYNKIVPIVNEVRILSHSLSIIKQLLSNELTLLLLSSTYDKSEAYNRIHTFELLFKEYFLKTESLTHGFHLVFNEVGEKLKTNYKKNYENKLLENLHKASSEIMKDFEFEISYVHNHLEEFEQILDKLKDLQNLKMIEKNKITWSDAIINLAQRSLETNLNEDKQALETLISLMLFELDTKECQHHLNILEAKLIETSRPKLKILLQNILLKDKQFSEKPLHFSDTSTFKSNIMKVVTLEEIINRASMVFKDDLSKFDQLARTNLCRIELTKDVFGNLKIWNEAGNTPQAESYRQWKKVILELLQNRTTTALQSIYCFVLLTFYHNLQIDQTFKINIDSLEEIVEFFLAENPANTPTQNYLKESTFIYKSKNVTQIPKELHFQYTPKIDTSDEICVNSLAGYLSCLLTRLKFVTNGIKSGAVVITSHQTASDILLADQENYVDSVKDYYLNIVKLNRSRVQKFGFSKRMMLRTALSCPSDLALSFFDTTKNKVDKCLCVTDNTRNVRIQIENRSYLFNLSDEVVLFKEIGRKKTLYCDEKSNEISYLVPCGLPLSAFIDVDFQDKVQQQTSSDYIKMQNHLPAQDAFISGGYYISKKTPLIKEEDKRKVARKSVSDKLKKLNSKQQVNPRSDKNSFFPNSPVNNSETTVAKEKEFNQEEKPFSTLN